MYKLYGLIVNLDRCIGCFACEVACKQEHKLTSGNGWIQVITLGPKSIDGIKRMDFIPIISDKCTFCKHRIVEDLKPFCVHSCPVRALEFLETTQILESIRSGRRYQICKIIRIEPETFPQNIGREGVNNII